MRLKLLNRLDLLKFRHGTSTRDGLLRRTRQGTRTRRSRVLPKRRTQLRAGRRRIVILGAHFCRLERRKSRGSRSSCGRFESANR